MYNPETGALPKSGVEIYVAHCAGCHGSDGGGGTGPRLAGKVADDFPDIEDQIAFVTKGKGGMPVVRRLTERGRHPPRRRVHPHRPRQLTIEVRF